MPSWPSTWKTRTLETAGIPATPKAVKALSAWSASTPTDPWTNNPLGMPAATIKAARVPGTPYAMLPSMATFYAAFAKFAATPAGKAVVSELISDGGYGPLWRAISGLKWPASATETDYPAKLLDLTSESYQQSVNATPAAKRKTSGVVKAPTAVHDAMRQQAAAITSAASSFGDAGKATRAMIRRFARNGK